LKHVGEYISILLKFMGAFLGIVFINNCEIQGKLTVVRRVGKIGKSDYQLLHVYSSASFVCPHVTNRIPLVGFSWILIIEFISIICRDSKFKFH